MTTCAQVPESRVSRKYSLNVRDSAVNEYRQIVQRWEDMTTAEGQSVSENYANGRFAIICDFNFSPPGGEFGGAPSSGGPFWKLKHLASLVFVANVAPPFEMHMRDKHPV